MQKIRCKDTKNFAADFGSFSNLLAVWSNKWLKYAKK